MRLRAGQKEPRRAAVEKATERQSAFSISFLRDSYSGMHATNLDSFLDAVRKVGLPEE